jgi:hypothetical protein
MVQAVAVVFIRKASAYQFTKAHFLPYQGNRSLSFRVGQAAKEWKRQEL